MSSGRDVVLWDTFNAFMPQTAIPSYITFFLLWVGPLATATLLWLSKHNFGTKSDVTSFIKPVDRRISFMKRPFPGVASNIPDTLSIFTRFPI